MRKWLRGGPKPAPPPRLDKTSELLAEFEEKGVLQVPSPHGEGVYTFLKDKPNIKDYPMTLYWSGKTHGSIVHWDYPGHGHNKEHPEWGGELAYWFFEKGAYSGHGTQVKSDDQKALVALILQFIQSGKRIYAHRCGSYVSVETDL